MHNYSKVSAFDWQGIMEFEAETGEKGIDQYSPSGIFILKGPHW